MKKAFLYSLVAVLCLLAVVGCSTSNNTASEPSGLTKAKSYLYAMYKDKVVATASDYTVVDTVMINGVSYSIEWSSDVDASSVSFVPGDKHMVTVDVNEKSPVDVSYTLTATLSDSVGNTETVSFPHTIPAFKESSWAEYKAAADDSTLVVKGVVTGIMSKTRGNSSNCLYLQDGDGGYYVYAMAADPIESGIEVGMTVRVTGAKDTYSGTLEIANATVEILDSGKTEYAPADWTLKYEAATSLKDEALTKEQALLVTIKGVEVTSQDTSSGYYKFKKNGLESYVRISSSVCPIDKDAQTALKNGHAEHYGWTADVTGVICVYDGAFYLSPVEGFDAFTYVSLPEKSDEEKIAFELDSLSLTDYCAEDTVIALTLEGAGYSDVAIEWTSDSPAAVVEGDKLVITLAEEATVATVTAKAKSGDKEGVKEFKVSIDALSTVMAGMVEVTEYKEYTPYALYTKQANINKNLFFAGSITGGKYLSTTDKDSKVARVFLEKDGEGWRIYTIVDGSKLYVEVVEGKAALNSEPQGNVWTINSEVNVPVTMVGDTEYYLGCYKTYDTFSASKTSYILNDTSVIGVSQFPMQIVQEYPAMEGFVHYSDIEGVTSVILSVQQNNINAALYFNGELTGGKYLATSRDASDAVVVNVEAEGEGYRLSFMDGETKTYIEIVDGKAALNPEIKGNVWSFNKEARTFVTVSGDNEYYLGCYKTYDTFSASKTSYILSDTSVIGVSQFPMEALSPIKALDTYVIKAENEVKEGVEYSLVVEQNNIGKVLYFGGSLTGGKYLSTTTDFSKNVVVSAQMEGEGFRLVTKDNKYVEIVDGKAAFNDSPLGSVWVLDSETGIPMTDCGGTMYYLGCYKTYETFSASKTSYISDTSVIGVSQFPVVLSYVAE